MPNYEHFRTFVWLCYGRSLRRDNDKFGSKSRKCKFVGYPFGQKGWRVYDLDTEEYFVSTDVVFSDTESAYASKTSPEVRLIQAELVVVDDDFHDDEMLTPADMGSSSGDEI